MKGLIRYILVATPLAVLLFLGLSAFFSSWDGRVVSVRSAPVAEPNVFTVLVVPSDGGYFELDWPADIVRELDLPVDNTGVPRTETPDDAPITSKSRFSLFFTVAKPGDDSTVVPTTSAWSLSLAALAWLVGLVLRNMWASGSPWDIESREYKLPRSQTPAGSAVQPASGSRGRKGPPPAKRRKGGGRR